MGGKANLEETVDFDMNNGFFLLVLFTLQGQKKVLKEHGYIRIMHGWYFSHFYFHLIIFVDQIYPPLVVKVA